MSHYKPEHYSTVSPYLAVEGAKGTIAFLKAVFDAEELRMYWMDEDTLMHGELRIEDSVIMLSDSNPDYPPTNAHIHIYVQDAQAVYDRALQAGATSVQPPKGGEDGDLRGGVRDAGGTTWWIATNVD